MSLRRRRLEAKTLVVMLLQKFKEKTVNGWKRIVEIGIESNESIYRFISHRTWGSILYGTVKGRKPSMEVNHFLAWATACMATPFNEIVYTR